ncbi:MAG: Ig-like domain-containing protein [Thermosynechococcaceae cyanobacterium]
MMIIFDRQTKEILSLASQVFDNGQWRETSLEELYPNTDHSQWGVVYAKEALKYVVPLHELRLKVDEAGAVVGVERKPKRPKLFLSTDALDTDGDGLPELAADGQSQATLTAQIRNTKGDRLSGDWVLDFRTTGGTLSARRVAAPQGQATVTLTASVKTISVTVTVAAEGVESCSMSFEFMPPADISPMPPTVPSTVPETLHPPTSFLQTVRGLFS